MGRCPLGIFCSRGTPLRLVEPTNPESISPVKPRLPQDDVSDDGGGGGAEGKAEEEEEEEELDDSESEYDSDGGKLSRAQRTVCLFLLYFSLA